MTGFTTRGEEEEGILDTIKSWNRPTIEASAASSGGKCKFQINAFPQTLCPNYDFPCMSDTTSDVSPPGPWDAFTITDGRIVTGANPASAHVTAEAAVKAFNTL